MWSSDIAYVRLTQGFAYLVAILDWFRRYVLSWSLSTTLETWFCVQALRTAAPQICNTDQGSRFASGAWLAELTTAGVAISMDGQGRVFDNIFTKRLWRSVKYEDVYLKDYAGVDEARLGLGGVLPLPQQASSAPSPGLPDAGRGSLRSRRPQR